MRDELPPSGAKKQVRRTSEVRRTSRPHPLAGEFAPAQRIEHDTPPRASKMGIAFPSSPANIRPSRDTPDAPASEAQPCATSSSARTTLRTRECNSQFPSRGGVLGGTSTRDELPPRAERQTTSQQTLTGTKALSEWANPLERSTRKCVAPFCARPSECYCNRHCHYHYTAPRADQPRSDMGMKSRFSGPR